MPAIKKGHQAKKSYSVRLEPMVREAINKLRFGLTDFIEESIRKDKELMKLIKDERKKLVDSTDAKD